jgi:hypothetical protein
MTEQMYGTPAGGPLIALNDQAAYDATDPSVQHLWTVVPEGTLVGATADPAHPGQWINPTPPPAATTTIITKTVLKERLGIKAMVAIRTSTDPTTKVVLGDFIDNDPTGTIDVAAPMAQGVVGYWAGLVDLGMGKLTGAGTPYIDPTQVAAILAPLPTQ